MKYAEQGGGGGGGGARGLELRTAESHADRVHRIIQRENVLSTHCSVISLKNSLKN